MADRIGVDVGERTCSVEGCELPHRARGWCRNHWTRWRKYGDVMADKPLINRGRDHNRICSIEDCGKPEQNRGWCSAHYTRWLRHGNADAEVRPYGVLHAMRCTVRGCEEVPRGKGLCAKHYAEQRWVRIAEHPCSVEGCRRPLYMRGWCNAHYQRWNLHGHPAGGGPERRVRGTGYPAEWYSEQRRRKIGWPIGETLEYVEILRGDPCSYCGALMEHIDHIQAVASGGSGDWTNLTAACAACNHRKGTRDLLDFLMDRG